MERLHWLAMILVLHVCTAAVLRKGKDTELNKFLGLLKFDRYLVDTVICKILLSYNRIPYLTFHSEVVPLSNKQDCSYLFVPPIRTKQPSR